jgi:hypothetical protein
LQPDYQLDRDIVTHSKQGVCHVAMESTGFSGKPIFNLLECPAEVLLLNAQPLKATLSGLRRRPAAVG